MIDHLMQHDVIPVQVTVDGYGNPSETELNTEKGFFEYNERRTFNTDGEVIDSKGVLFLNKDTQFDPTAEDANNNKYSWKFKDVKNDRTYDGQEPQIIDDPRTGNTHHYEILLR